MKATAFLVLATLLAAPSVQGAQAPEAATDVEAFDDLKVPDVPLIDQDGKPVRFYTDLVKGKVVAVNFVFTTCTTICPPMGANFARLEKLVAGKDVHLISVSIDPAADTPARLKEWGGKFGAGPGWTLLTGNRDDVVRLLKALNVYTASVTDHSPLVLLGNEPGHRWTRAYGLAAPAKLAALIDRIAAPAAGAAARRETRP
jgi:cytochrome oxidase Cu insertion factor (SCO1/SenC/PrrC family)